LERGGHIIEMKKLVQVIPWHANAGTEGSPFATSALEGDGWLTPHLGQFIPGKDQVPAAQRLMGLGTSLDRQRKSLPQRDLIPGPSSP